MPTTFEACKAILSMEYAKKEAAAADAIGQRLRALGYTDTLPTNFDDLKNMLTAYEKQGRVSRHVPHPPSLLPTTPASRPLSRRGILCTTTLTPTTGTATAASLLRRLPIISGVPESVGALPTFTFKNDPPQQPPAPPSSTTTSTGPNQESGASAAPRFD
jgi:hypothetical protein